MFVFAICIYAVLRLTFVICQELRDKAKGHERTEFAYYKDSVFILFFVIVIGARKEKLSQLLQ